MHQKECLKECWMEKKQQQHERKALKPEFVQPSA